MHIIRVRGFLLVCLGLLVSTASLVSAAPLVRTLDNGLRLVVEHYPSAPVAAVRFYVHTGSVHEGKYLGAGISHLVEHCVDRGSVQRSAEEIREAFGQLGDNVNAYTTRGFTCYHCTTSADQAIFALEVMADYVLAPTFPEEGVDQERQIILREMRQGEDEPRRVVYKLFFSTLFRRHPQRYSIIGYRESFEALTAADATAYHHDRYAPDNVAVTLVGDFDPEQVLQQVVEILEAYPKRATQSRPLPTEPPLTVRRVRVQEQDGLQRAHLLLGWRSVTMFDDDMYPLDLLAVILGRGDSSRLVARLKHEQGLVDSVWAYSNTPTYDAGAYLLGATCDPDQVPQVQEALLTEIRRVHEEGVTAEEAERAKHLVRADLVFAQQTVAGRAESLGVNLLMTGDAEFDVHYLERLEQVTPAQVQAVAQHYLDPEVYALVVLQPPAAAEPQPPAAESVDRPQSTMVTLDNGLRVVIAPQPGAGTVQVVTATQAGLRLEPEGKAGLSNFCAEMLTRGTADHSREQIAQRLEERGARLEAYSGRNSLGLIGQALVEDAHLLLETLAECLTRPIFPPVEITSLRRQTLAQIAAQQESPHWAASLLLKELLFPDHPYHWPQTGTRETVESFTRPDLADFHAAICSPPGTVLLIAGDLSRSQARELADKYLGDWRAEPQAVPEPAPQSPPTQRYLRTAEREQRQGIIYYGWLGPRVDSADRYGWEVLEGVLAARSNVGRIFPPLRDAGLVYAAGAYVIPGLDPGQAVIYAATELETVATVQEKIEVAVRALQEAPLTEEELAQVKHILVTTHALSLADPEARAQIQALDELYGLGYDNSQKYAERIERVTAQQVQQLARERLNLDRCAVVVTRPLPPAEPSADHE